MVVLGIAILTKEGPGMVILAKLETDTANELNLDTGLVGALDIESQGRMIPLSLVGGIVHRKPRIWDQGIGVRIFLTQGEGI